MENKKKCAFSLSSEWKILFTVERWRHFLRLWLLCREMHSVAVDIDCFAGLNGTGMFTCAAADTNFILDFRHNKPLIIRNHLHRFCRTMFRTGAAIFFLRYHNTILFHEVCFPDLNLFFTVYIQRQNSACRTYLAAKNTIEIAIACRIIHFWLEYSCDSIFKKRW